MKRALPTTSKPPPASTPSGVFGTPSPPIDPAPGRPNILFIVTDDQAIGTLDATDPATGEPWMAKTLTRFGGTTAQGNPVGTNFTQAFATTPNCCPSRASIMTGKYSHNHQVRTNNDKDNLALHNTTLQHYLHEAGYRTGMFGKYLNRWVALGGGGNTGKPLQNPPDFDEWAVFDNGSYFPEDPQLPQEPACPDETNDGNSAWGVDCVNESTGGGAGHLTEAPPYTYATTYVADKASAFIENGGQLQSAGKPWFLYVAPTAPHSGWKGGFPAVDPYAANAVPAPQVTASNEPEADVADKPPSVQAQRTAADGFSPQGGNWEALGLGPDAPCGPQEVTETGPLGFRQCLFNVRRQQFRMLKSVDDLVERLFTALEATNQQDDTLVVFISDNGFLWNDHGLFGKQRPYLESVRVPLLMRWPNRVMSPTDSSLVANVDLAPTALGAARLPIPPDMDGVDLLAPGRAPRDRLLLEIPNWVSLIKPGLQYTEHDQPGPSEEPLLWPTGYGRPDSGEGTPVREYYDLTADPLELTNLLHDGVLGNEPPTLAALHDELSQARSCARRSGPTACP